MPEITEPQDPMQAVAYARIAATELGKDARHQAEACQQSSVTLGVLADSLDAIARLITGPMIDPVMIHSALLNIVGGTRAVGLGIQETVVRLEAHAQGWEREEKVWASIMERSEAEKKP